MRLNPHLQSDGQCEAAFKLYEQCLGGKIVMMMTYGESPASKQTAPDWQKKIIHERLVVGDQVLMGSDAPPERSPRPFFCAIS